MPEGTVAARTFRNRTLIVVKTERLVRTSRAYINVKVREVADLEPDTLIAQFMSYEADTVRHASRNSEETIRTCGPRGQPGGATVANGSITTVGRETTNRGARLKGHLSTGRVYTQEASRIRHGEAPTIVPGSVVDRRKTIDEVTTRMPAVRRRIIRKRDHRAYFRRVKRRDSKVTRKKGNHDTGSLFGTPELKYGAPDMTSPFDWAYQDIT